MNNNHGNIHRNSENYTKEIDGNKRLQIETEDVPLYRSYGVIKKVNPVKRFFSMLMLRGVTILLFAAELSILITVTVAFAIYSSILISTLMFIIAFSVLFFHHTKLPRRRLSFLRKLKKEAKANGIELEFRRGFFKSLTWADGDTVDFVAKAGKWTYYVKFATTKRFWSSFLFVSKDEVKHIKLARRGNLAIIFNSKNKIKDLKIVFPADIDADDKYSVKAILINPAVMNIERKSSDGATVPTGSGEKLFGYTIYTGSGFIETLKRNIEDEKTC